MGELSSPLRRRYYRRRHDESGVGLGVKGLFVGGMIRYLLYYQSLATIALCYIGNRSRVIAQGML